MADETADAAFIQAGQSPQERQRLFAEAFVRYRPRLRQMVDWRLGPALRADIDPSDIVQDSFLDAARRLEEYLAQVRVPFYPWLRILTRQRLSTLYRRHVAGKERSRARTISLDTARVTESSAVAFRDIAARNGVSPSEAAAKRELEALVRCELDALDELDREILVLRHFEGLSCVDAARELEITDAAARKRYARALKRFGAAFARHARKGGAP